MSLRATTVSPSRVTAAGHYRYTVMYTDTAGHNHTKNVAITVKAKPKR